MTSAEMHPQEAAFWAAIEADPADATVRLAFADWMDEVGDGRADGMRALGVLGHRAWKISPLRNEPSDRKTWNWYDVRRVAVPDVDPPSDLPTVWFAKLSGGDRLGSYCTYCSFYASENAACRAFVALTRAEQAELLNPQPAGVA